MKKAYLLAELHVIQLADIKKEVSQVLEQNEAFQSHPNECELHFIDDFETCILYGLQWLILRTSPYDLTRNQSN